MTRKTDTSGKRAIQLEGEVPGTPEQVWQAIATGPGIAAWFTPTTLDERQGGTVHFDLGPGMESSGTVTVWEPPRRLVYEERDWAPGAPPLATEFLVEARGGGRCLVRLVTSLFSSSDDWDDQLASMEKGWTVFMHLLRLYLTHVPGQAVSFVRAQGSSTAPEADVWTRLTRALGLAAATQGQPVASGPGVPTFAGTVDRVGEREITLRLEKPARGHAMLSAHTWAEKVHPCVYLYLFGPDAPAAAAREEPAWRAWMDRLGADPV